jgi:diaminopimelate decarboxylase
MLLRRASERWGTPLFVYDGDAIRGMCERLNGLMPPGVQLLYSIKANPNAAVAEIVRAQGWGVEVASAGEFGTALEAGFGPANVVAAGPAKTRLELERYVDGGIGLIHVESLAELRALEETCQARGKVQRALFRVNPSKVDSGARIKMGGKPSQFGIDEEQLEAALLEADAARYVRIVGLHVYFGTQILNANRVLENVRHVVGLAVRSNRSFEVLNFGGGFGIALNETDEALDEERLRCGLPEAIGALQATAALEECRVVFELGRYVTGRAGYLVTRVVDVKDSRGHRYVTLDGGINCAMSLAPILRFDRSPPRVRVLPAREQAEPARAALGGGPVELVGPACTPLDALGGQVVLPALHAGDMVVFENVGAYGLTMSPVLFLGRSITTEVVLSNHGQPRWRASGDDRGWPGSAAVIEYAVHRTRSIVPLD